MKSESNSAAELLSACRLWIAAAEAKDQRIAELERECEQLRMQVARVTRRAGPRGVGVARRNAADRGSGCGVRRRTPTMA